MSSFEDLSEGRPVLVLSPHPDDEALGCGALLAAAFAGPGAHVVSMTDGGASHPNSCRWPPDAIAALRRRELDAALSALGGSRQAVTRLGLPDGGMLDLAHRFPEIARQIAKLAGALGIRSLFAPAETDPHCDHLATAQIARLAAADAGVRLLSYPIWSRWAAPDFRDHLPAHIEHRLDATGSRTAKCAAIAAHATQHGRIIADDPEGFVLPREFLRLFETGDEIFFEERTS
jgi:LmbE family N-acetylglucosaminyl deacetylase